MKNNKLKRKSIISMLLLMVYFFTSISTEINIIRVCADEYTSEEIIKPQNYSYGDFNTDGAIDIFDLMHCRQHLLNGNEQPLNIADIDGNGAFDSHDDSVLKGYLLLKEGEYSGKLNSSFSETSVTDKYNYVVFAGSKDASALTINAETITNNNIVATNGISSISGNKSGSGSFIDEAGISIVRMNNKITEKYFEDAVTYDEINTSEANIDLETPVYSYDEIYIGSIDSQPTSLINRVCMMSINNINIECDNDNELEAVLYSKYGDVSIKCNNINIKGLIYAPFGTVELTANDININGAVIAKKVIINGKNKVNLNCNNYLPEFIGIDSENMVIPYEDWDYMPIRNDSFFPDIVEEQILEDPLSVDDEWLYDYYGEEVTEEYAESKEDLVNYLYMSQIDDIDNYDEIIDVLYDASVNGTSENIKLEASVNKPITLNVYGNKITVEKEKKATYDYPIGPSKPPEIYVYKTDDGKKIKNIKTYLEMAVSGILGVGATIKTAVEGVASTVVLGSSVITFLTDTAKDILSKLSLSTGGAEEQTKLVEEAFADSINEVGDKELFGYKVKYDDGSILISSENFDFRFIESEGNWKVSLEVNDKEILSNVSIDNIFKSDEPKISTEPILSKENRMLEPEGIRIIRKADGIKAENQAAQILCNYGFEVEILPEIEGGNGYGIKLESNPDWLINKSIDYGCRNINGEAYGGRVFDCYSPSGNIDSIIKAMHKKLKNQSKRLVINCVNLSDEDIEVLIENIYSQLKNKLKSAEEIIIIIPDSHGKNPDYNDVINYKITHINI